MKPRSLMALAIASALVLGGCATATPYQPFGVHGAKASGGYRETQIEPQRWRVTFAGNTLTSRETVETYLLYRAAELTAQNGFDWFSAVDRNTTEHTEEHLYRNPDVMPLGQSWSPYWRHRSRWWIWRDWDPMDEEPFFDVQRVTDYEASAEIVLGRGAKPADDPKAYDARAVLASLKDKVARPA